MSSILVIGKSSGIGFKLMNKLAEQGYNVSTDSRVCNKKRVTCIAPSLTDTRLTQNLINTDEKRAQNK
jgi:short-subunit dehydrogenase